MSELTAPLRKPRIPFAQRVWVRTSDQGTPREAYAGNLSETGIFVQTTEPPTVGTRVILQFSVDEGETIIDAVAEVVWVKPFEPINVDGVLPGMGARFLSIDNQNLTVLRSYIGNKLRRAPSSEARSAPRPSGAMPFEKAMSLQLKGDRELILGYSVEVNQDGIKFHPDFLPNDSMLNRLKNRKSAEQKIKGCIAVPVEIGPEQLQYVASDNGKSNLEVQLNFIELRSDLLQSATELTRRTLTKIPTEESAVPQNASSSGTVAASATKDGWKVGLMVLIAALLGMVIGYLGATYF